MKVLILQRNKTMKHKLGVYSLLGLFYVFSANHAQAGTCPPHSNYDECVKAEDETRQSKKREATEDKDMLPRDKHSIYLSADYSHEKGVSDCARTCKKNNDHKDNGNSQHKTATNFGNNGSSVKVN